MISIGYSTCHWCHVMSRESFDDEATADILNQKVVSIKVDREEHPEVDSLYMAQAQAFTDHLGWPLTIFATPEGAAFYAQTYLPPEPRAGQPSLLQVVEAVSTAWREKRDEVLQSSRALVEALADATGGLEKEVERSGFSLGGAAVGDCGGSGCPGRHRIRWFRGAPQISHLASLVFPPGGGLCRSRAGSGVCFSNPVHVCRF